MKRRRVRPSAVLIDRILDVHDYSEWIGAGYLLVCEIRSADLGGKLLIQAKRQTAIGSDLTKHSEANDLPTVQRLQQLTGRS